MRVAKPRTVIALAAVIAISMSEASQAETVRLKTSRGTVCTAEASVSATTGMSKSVTYGAEVPRCGNREGLRRIQSLGLLYGEGTLVDSGQSAGPAPFAGFQTFSGGDPGTTYQARVDISVRLGRPVGRRAKRNPEKFVSGKGAGFDCRVTTTRRSSDTIFCQFIGEA